MTTAVTSLVETTGVAEMTGTMSVVASQVEMTSTSDALLLVEVVVEMVVAATVEMVVAATVEMVVAATVAAVAAAAAAAVAVMGMATRGVKRAAAAVAVEVHQSWLSRHLVLGLPPSPPPTFLVATAYTSRGGAGVA